MKQLVNTFKNKLLGSSVHKAFQCAESDDVHTLLTLLENNRCNPNIQRFAVLEKTTFNWSETLLSCAVRNNSYNCIVALVEHGANPYTGDWINPELTEGLRKQARQLIVDDQGLITDNPPLSKSFVVQSALKSASYTDHPVLHALTAIEYFRHQNSDLSVAPQYQRISETNPEYRCVASVTELNEWIQSQWPIYEANKTHKVLTESLVGVETAPRQKPKI